MDMELHIQNFMQKKGEKWDFLRQKEQQVSGAPSFINT